MKKSLFLSTCLIATLFTSCGGSVKPSSKTYNFSFTGEKCRINNQSSFSEEIKENESRIYTINVDEGRDLIASDVIIEGENVEFDEANCQIRISKMTSNVKVTATINDDIAFRFIGTNCKINNKSFFSDRIPLGETRTYPVTITDPNCTLLESDLTIIGGDKRLVSFNENTKEITVLTFYASSGINVAMKARHTYTFDFTGTNCKINGKAHFVTQIREDEVKEFPLIVNKGYYLFENDITITGLGAYKVIYDWVSENIIVDGMVGDVNVKAPAQAHSTYKVVFIGANCKGKTPKTEQPASDFEVELSKDDKANLVISLSYDKEKYQLPHSIAVYYGRNRIGQPNVDYIYNHEHEQGTITLLKKEPASVIVNAVDYSIGATLRIKTSKINEKVALNTTDKDLIYYWGDGERSTTPEHVYKDNNVYDITIEGKLTNIAISDKNLLIALDMYSPVFSSIPVSGFAYCNNLLSIGFSHIITFEKFSFDNCKKLSEVFFANSSGLSTIGEAAFYRCFALTSFALPYSVKSIEDTAFHECTSLADFKISNSSLLEKVGSQAFAFTKLKSFKFPSCINDLENFIFFKSKNLTQIDLTSFTGGENIPVINKDTFQYTNDNIKFYVRNDTAKNKFINTEGWNAYKERFTTDPLPVF